MPIQKHTPPLSSEDSAFFQKFYEENKGFLYYITQQYASSSADCEDLIQDTLIRLLRNIQKLKPLTRGQTAKYIALTAKSVYLDNLKKSYASQEVAVTDSVMEALLEETVRQDSAADGLAVKWELSELRSSLSARDWFVLEGKYILGYDQEELSRLIGVSPDSVRMILCRARKKARSILLSAEENGGGENG